MILRKINAGILFETGKFTSSANFFSTFGSFGYFMLSFINHCRMLMDYPFKKQTDVNYRDHVTSLVAKKQIRQQVTANTIRICLLEEQNDELRHRTMEEAREHKRRNEGSEAPKVWKLNKGEENFSIYLFF